MTMKSPLATWRAEFGVVPTTRWTSLVTVAIGGSLVYGASLALVLPGWKFASAALWLALSAGLAWGVLIPVLRRIGRVPFVPCCDACLVTMAVGEIVLTIGAICNLLLWQSGGIFHAVALNGIVVGISNVVMVEVLAHRLKTFHVSRRRTWIVWMLALNGSGALFFFIFYQWLHRA